MIIDNEFYYIGEISKKHGLKNNLILSLDTDDIKTYINTKKILILDSGCYIPFCLEKCSIYKKNKLLIQIKDSIRSIDWFIKKEVYLRTNTLPKLGDMQFYYHEILGFNFISIEDDIIGTIIRVNDKVPQPYFEIKSMNNIILIPIIGEWIQKISRNKKYIKSYIPPGLIELYTKKI